jgi:hypothetical protein
MQNLNTVAFDFTLSSPSTVAWPSPPPIHSGLLALKSHTSNIYSTLPLGKFSDVLLLGETDGFTLAASADVIGDGTGRRLVGDGQAHDALARGAARASLRLPCLLSFVRIQTLRA